MRRAVTVVGTRSAVPFTMNEDRNDMKNGIDWQAVERHYGLELKMLLKLKYETGTTSTPETGATDIS